MSEYVHARTDHGDAGWWCDLHECWTGERDWCFHCDGVLAAETKDGAA